MKVDRILVAASIVLLSQFARSEEPKPDPKVLAIAEAVLTYCAKAAPSTTAKYHDSFHQITKGASDETLADLRKSDAYLQARQSLDEFLAKVDEHDADKVCSQSLAQKQ